MVNVEPIGNKAIQGEGPHWDDKKQVLYFVDMRASTVNKYDPATKIQTPVTVGGGNVSIVIPVEGKDDQFVITNRRNVAIMTWDGKSNTPTKIDVISTVDDEDGKRDNNINDGKVDPTGRLWAGTLAPFTDLTTFELGRGSLFSFSKDGKATTHVKEVDLSNGITWSLDGKTMYYIDTMKKNIQAFDFNAKVPELSNRRVVFDFEKNNLDSYPDGMTIDTEGMLWVACFEGGQVIRVDPNSGRLLRTISVPAPRTTSVIFGGPNLDELYVTSFSYGLSEEQLKKYPYSGHTFRVTGVGAKGLPLKNVQLE